MTVSSVYPPPPAGNGALSRDSQNVVPRASWATDLSRVGAWARAAQASETIGVAARAARKRRRCIAVQSTDGRTWRRTQACRVLREYLGTIRRTSARTGTLLIAVKC